MKCITNIYGLSSGDWTLCLKLVVGAIVKFNKLILVSSCTSDMVNKNLLTAHVPYILSLMIYIVVTIVLLDPC